MRSHSRSKIDTDVLIIGSGLVGAVVGRVLGDARPDLQITVVDAGPPGEPKDGDTADPIFRRYADAQWVADARQNGYGCVAPRIVSPEHLGNDGGTVPGVSLAFNVEGLGLHWRGATPSPSGSEVPSVYSEQEWADLLAQAKGLLRVRDDLDATRETAVLGRLDRACGGSDPDRSVKGMPLALASLDPRVPTRPRDIFAQPYMGLDERYSLRPRTLCRRVAEFPRWVEVELVDLAADVAYPFRARRVVLAADALRTPQILFNSDLTMNVGRRLMDHAVLSCFLGHRPAHGAPFNASEMNFWVPADDDRHAGVTGSIDAQVTDAECGYVNVEWFVVPDEESGRMSFSTSVRDHLGLPKFELEYERRIERRRLEQLSDSTSEIFRALGVTRHPPAVTQRAPGVSQHLTGTVPIGTGEWSAADKHGKVRSTDRVYVAGNGVIPTAISCNPTLTSAAIAVSTAQTIAREVSGG